MNRRNMLKLTGISLLAATGLRGSAALAAEPAAPTTPTKPEAAVPNSVSVSVYNEKGELVGPVSTPRVVKTDEEWKKQLTAEQYQIARAKGTERPFCGNLLDNHQEGTYVCVCCGLPLFSSAGKFNSGTGWPSFFQPVAKGNVIEHEDTTHGIRTEILCARCDCHLGHVFNDGPRPTGLRFCVNSESLKFTAADKLATLADTAAKVKAEEPAKPAK